ncbi:MerR family transcriptional regulator [Paenibacillus beijingensis]|uniref:HTH merR-type domain-containing protein n=1 Tax=Paenibacillus beijingensis TaxID=1126833 RepID=A0A0D5NF82_9BACL|nr:MerR family transcriptional regulator [Paenibacillus beijingensis]AJY73583.1 hypothetical protein VN24_01745 [Paenibacillus beijingensis]
MKINEVMGKTRLTRKAIYYYEKEGLLHPQTETSNHYRHYTDEDVNKLLSIRLLRQLDIPVDEIKKVLYGQALTKTVLEEQLSRVSASLERLQRIKENISSLLNGHPNRSPCFIELAGLAKSYSDDLESEMKQRSGYMARKLFELFPGTFGRVMALHFGVFLNEPIMGDSMEQAWAEIVEYLDGLEEIDLPKTLVQQMDLLSDQEIEQLVELYHEQLRKFVSPDERQYEQLKDEFRNITAAFAAVPFAKEQIWITKEIKIRLDKNRFYEVFVHNISILSADYRSYQETLHRLQHDFNVSYIDNGLLIL